MLKRASLKPVLRPLLLLPLLLLSVTMAQAQEASAFEYVPGGPFPEPEFYTLRNPVGNALPVSVTADKPWIRTSLSSPYTPAILMIAVQPAGLTPGVYSGFVRVASSVNVIQIPVILTIREPTGVPTANPSHLSFRTSVGRGGAGYEQLPPAQVITVGSTGQPIRVQAQSMQPWLLVSGVALSPGFEGYTPGYISISVSQALPLPQGTYNGSVRLTSGQQIMDVPVTLTVDAPVPLMSVNGSELNFTAVTGSESADQQLSVTSSGSPLSFTVSDVPAWLSVSMSGTTPATLTFRARTTGLPVGDVRAVVGITSGSQVLRVTVSLKVLPDNRPVISSVVSGNNGARTISSGAWVSIFGRHLTDRTRIISDQDLVAGALPKTVDGIRVYIGGQLCPLHYLSPTQLNVLVPVGLTGYVGSTTAEVVTATGTASTTVEVRDVTPGAFTLELGGRRVPAAILPGGSTLLNRAAKPGEILSIYGSGFGPTTPIQADGVVVPTTHTLAFPIDVRIGDVPAKLHYSGLVGPGLYQLNVEVPALPTGNHQLMFQINGSSSPTGVMIPVAE